VVSSSHCGCGGVHHSATYSRGPLPTVAFMRVLISTACYSERGASPLHPCEGKTTQTPWSLPRAPSSSARAGPMRRELVCATAGTARSNAAALPVAAQACGGQRLVGCESEMPPSPRAAAAATARRKGRGRILFTLNTRVSLSAPAWYECRAAGSPCVQDPRNRFSSAVQASAAQGTPPWLHAHPLLPNHLSRPGIL